MTPFSKIQKTGFVNECINDWSDTLHLLAPDRGGLLWPRLNPLKRLMSLARKNCPDLTIEDAKNHDWEGFNFLDKAALTKKAAKVYDSLDTEWEKQREAVRKRITQDLNCEKWKKDNPSHKQEEQAAALLTRYGGKKLTDLRSQKNIYWLYADQMIPSKHIFRDKVKKNYEQDWRKIDTSKLYLQACMESFQWRSAHGKLYARRDLVKFG
jgi:hypothetical protein